MDRKPWLAALLEVLQPGLGHLYLAQPLWAVAACLCFFTVLIVAGICLVRAPLPFDIAALALLPLVRILFVIHAWRGARIAPSPFTLTRWNRWAVYGIYVIVMGVPSVLIGFPGLHGFRVPSGSMEPTLLVGDFFFDDEGAGSASRLTRGDIISFHSVEEKGLLVVKRIVAIPGDTVAMTHGRLLIDGRGVLEPYVTLPNGQKEEEQSSRDQMAAWQRPFYLGKDSATYMPGLQDWGPLLVPEGFVFVLGDNRDASYDGRYWGFLPLANVVGQPLIIYWSYASMEANTSAAGYGVRWERIGRRVRLDPAKAHWVLARAAPGGESPAEYSLGLTAVPAR